MKQTLAIIKGDKALLYVLKTLKDSAQKKVLRPALVKAVRPIARAAKGYARKGETGALKAAIQTKVATVKSTGELWAAVGIGKGPRFWRVKAPPIDGTLRVTRVARFKVRHTYWNIGKGGKLRELKDNDVRKGELWYARMTKTQMKRYQGLGYGRSEMPEGKILNVAKPGRYAHLVERGHGGPHRARAYPFLSKGFNATKGSALEIVRQDAWRNLNKVVGATRWNF